MSVPEEECIIAHLPFLLEEDEATASESSSSQPPSLTTVVKEVQNCAAIPEDIRRHVLFHLQQQKPAPKRAAVSQSNNPVVKTTPLPVVHLDSLNMGDCCCWWCTHPTPNQPIHLPHSYSEGVFQVTGYFCSFNCALAYSLDRRDTASFQRSNLLCMMYNLYMTDSTVSSLVPAPPRELLKRFGGWMTIEEFRQSSAVLSLDTRVLLPPLQSVFYTVECQKRITSSSTYPKANSAFVPLDHSHVTKAKESLKLKRNAPRKTNYVSLEETMGIVKRPKDQQ